ncbi:hypothetical protein N431DRAFT_470407 [Stipitochalara longipes BDJ]|nr:hypothetical protein N431DRAFT_470407 [Stipitochalara longipes BDJ]
MRVQIIIFCLAVVGTTPLTGALPTDRDALATRGISNQGALNGILLGGHGTSHVLAHGEHGDLSKRGGDDGKHDKDHHDDNNKDDDEDCDYKEKGNGDKNYKPSKGY